jgi:nucleotide-binding universal stress UspA family protein
VKTNERMVSPGAIAPSLLRTRFRTGSGNPRPSCRRANLRSEIGFTEERVAVSPTSPVVLVPFDLSPENDASVTLGITMARQMGAQLILVHALLLNLDPYSPVNLYELKTELCHDVITRSGTVIRSAREQGVMAMLAIEEGSPAAVINQAAERWHPDLIVMSSRHHKHLLSRIFRRRTIDKVVGHTKCPILVLQQEEQKELSHE